jgi:hypothetical protein
VKTTNWIDPAVKVASIHGAGDDVTTMRFRSLELLKLKWGKQFENALHTLGTMDVANRVVRARRFLRPIGKRAGGEVASALVEIALSPILNRVQDALYARAIDNQIAQLAPKIEAKLAESHEAFNKRLKANPSAPAYVNVRLKIYFHTITRLNPYTAGLDPVEIDVPPYVAVEAAEYGEKPWTAQPKHGTDTNCSGETTQTTTVELSQQIDLDLLFQDENQPMAN